MNNIESQLKAFAKHIDAAKNLKKTQKWLALICDTNEAKITRYKEYATGKKNVPKNSNDNLVSSLGYYNRVLEKEFRFRDTVKKSELIPPFYHKLFWFLPIIIGCCFLLFYLLIANKPEFSLNQHLENTTQVSVIFGIGYLLNVTIVGTLLTFLLRIKIKHNKKSNVGWAIHSFFYYWKAALLSWIILYLIRLIFHAYLIEIHDVYGMTKIMSVSTNEIGVILTIITSIVNAFNSAFLFYCYLLLDIVYYHRVENRRLQVRLRNFFILLSLFLTCSLLDKMFFLGNSFDSLLSILYSCFMAAAFILLVSKLSSRYFKRTSSSSMTIGFIFFYAACMPVFAAISSSSPLFVSAIVTIVFALGKLVFGNLVNSKMSLQGEQTDNTIPLHKYFSQMYQDN